MKFGLIEIRKSHLIFEDVCCPGSERLASTVEWSALAFQLPRERWICECTLEEAIGHRQKRTLCSESSLSRKRDWEQCAY